METLTVVDLTDYLAKPSLAEMEMAHLFRRHEGIVVFDIGACEGEDSIRYARRFPRARIFAFEPLPENQKQVRENFRRYQLAAAELVPMALSDRPGTAVLHVSSGRPPTEFCGPAWNYGNKSSSLLPPVSPEPMHGWIQYREQIIVTCETIDNFCLSRGLTRIDFVHMDVQGAEYCVLRGASHMLRHTVAIWLEVAEKELYRGQRLRGDIEKFMHAHGFVCAVHENRGVEGDQLYVNTRFVRAHLYRVGSRVRGGLRRVFHAAARVRTRLLPL